MIRYWDWGDLVDLAIYGKDQPAKGWGLVASETDGVTCRLLRYRVVPEATAAGARPNSDSDVGLEMIVFVSA